jgi:hypothetical protein
MFPLFDAYILTILHKTTKVKRKKKIIPLSYCTRMQSGHYILCIIGLSQKKENIMAFAFNPKWFPKASSSQAGIAKAGNGIVVDDDGLMSTVRRHSWQFTAGSFESCLDPDWKVAANAVCAIDANNKALLVRSYSATAFNGVGFLIHNIPECTSLRFTFQYRCTTSVTQGGIVWKLYSRLMNNGLATGAWNNGYGLPACYASTTVWRTFQTDVTLSALGITAGDTRQFELVRDVTAAADDLASAVYLLAMTVECL